MPRMTIMLAVLLVLAVGSPTVVAQVETPVPALPGTPPLSLRPRQRPTSPVSRRCH